MQKYRDDPKTYYVKENVSTKEYRLHSYVYKLGIVNMPAIVKYDEESQVMVLIRVGVSSVADWYGSESHSTPAPVFKQIHNIVATLAENNIEYADVTGFNFMINPIAASAADDDQPVAKKDMWVIDFGDAQFKANGVTDPYVIDLLADPEMNEWNPHFT